MRQPITDDGIIPPQSLGDVLPDGDDVEAFESVEQITRRFVQLKAMVRERGIALAFALEALGGELRVPHDKLLEFDYRGKELETFMDLESRAVVVRLRQKPSASPQRPVDNP